MLIVPSLLALIAATPDAWIGRTLKPVSRTATAITGPVRIAASAITFSKRTVAATRVVSTRAGSVYRLDHDPGQLLQRNYLCGRTDPVRFVVVTEETAAWGRTVTLAAFADAKVPNDQSEPCATFSFE